MVENKQAGFPCDAVPDDPGTARLAGLYPQRQEGLWMQRVKLLGSILSGGQWKSLARIARQFTPTAPLHLTTRQDIELHDVPADRVGDVQHAIAEADLTALGACGDTLRNITVCPCSGVSSSSVNLLPLAWLVRRELESIDGIYSLPRKLKISFSCSGDCGQPWINCLGFVAVNRNGRWGFSVVTAGSLGARPATGIRLFDWIDANDVLPLTVAVARVFAVAGDRENRSRARLRHVRERLGDGKFVALLEEAFASEKASRTFPEVQMESPGDGFDERIALTFANGHVSTDQAEAIGEIASRDEFRVRIDTRHRVVLFARDVSALREAIAAHEPLARTAKPQPTVIACPGSKWCSRALVETNGIAERLREKLSGVLDAESVVCVSGCPNGCAHSRVAQVGLTGVLVKRGAQRVAAYDLYAGGSMGVDSTLAQLVSRRLSADDAIAEVTRLAQEASNH